MNETGRPWKAEARGEKSKVGTSKSTAWILIGLICLSTVSGLARDAGPDRDYVGPAQALASTRPLQTIRLTTGTLTEGPEIVSLTSTPMTAFVVSVSDAILTALENNRSLAVQRLNPAIRRTGEDVARAAFDPDLTAGISQSQDKTEQKSAATGKTMVTRTERTAASIGVSEFLPTGTNIGLNLTTQRNETEGAGDQSNSRIELAITQALLRGAGLNVNLATLRQARLDTEVSQYELRGVVETLVAQVEETYWDYSLAKAQMKIFTDSLKLAEAQLAETEERIKVGKLAPTELPAAQAEVALRHENVINGRSTLLTTRLNMLRLLSPESSDLWSQDLVLKDEPATPTVVFGEVTSHVQVALRWRPDLNQARLAIQRSEIDLVVTRNGLLPKLDTFITLGGTGYADSFGGSVRAEDGKTRDLLVGLNFEYPLLNRAARARNQKSRLSRDQVEEALANTGQLVEVDVRSAYIEVNRAAEQVAATAATRKLQEEVLRAETEKLRIGKSTSILVARAQRDLLSAQIDEVKAVVAHLKALVELWRLEGSLLERRGIIAPGRYPVSEAPPRRKP